MKLEQSERLFVQQLFKEFAVKNLGFTSEKKATVAKLTGDASTRRYYRVGEEKKSYVLCLDGPRDIEKHDYEFYSIAQYFQKNKIRVPHIYDVNVKKGYILQEDLGDLTLLNHLAEIQNTEDEFGLYKQCIDILINIQKTTFAKEKNKFISERAFDPKKYIFEFNHCHDYFINKLLKSDQTAETKNIFFSFYQDISLHLSSLPRVVTHRDFHSRNLMWHNGELVVIDFQDARMGPLFYDLVSLLDDCYYSLNSQNKPKLIDYYIESLPDQLVHNDFKRTFERNYELMKVQRLYKAVGSFAYIYHERKDVRYLKYIGKAMEEIKKSLLNINEYAEFRKKLFEIYYGC
jgi:hypothetical protein